MKPLETTPAQLASVISNHEAHGANFVSMRLSCPIDDALKFERETLADKQARGDAKRVKSANTFGAIVKHSHIQAIVAFDYASNVNKQREREGVTPNFKARANWFEHVSPAIVTHKQTRALYAFVRVLRNLTAPIYTVDGIETPKADLLAVLPVDDLNDAERALYGIAPEPFNDHQGIEKEIQPITIKLANVREFVSDGFTYLVTPEPTTVTPEPLTRTRPARVPVPQASVLEVFTRMARDIGDNPHAYEGQF